MASIRKIDTSVAQIVKTLKYNTSADSVCVLDAESTVYTGGGGLIFDFAYGFSNVRSGQIGKPTGYLVYEVIKDDLVIEEISNWGKIKNQAKGNLYDFYNLLKQHGWWNESVFPKGEISKEIAEIQRKTIEEQYEKQRVTRAKLQNGAHYHKTRDKWKEPTSYSREQYDKRIIEIQGINAVIDTMKNFLDTGENLRDLIESKAISSNARAAGITKDIYRSLYLQQKQTYNNEVYKSDKALFAQLEISYKIKRWKSIISEFDNRLKDVGSNLLAIVSYNIGPAEKRFIRNTCQLLGTPEYSNIIDKYDSLCLMNLTALLDALDADKIQTLVASLDEEGMVEGLQKALSEYKLPKRQSFEFNYKSLMGVEEYTQSHTAPGDVKDESVFTVEKIGELARNILSIELSSK